MNSKNRLSLRMKLICLFLILWCVPILIIFTVWYYKTSDTIETNAINSNKQYIEKLNNHIDYYFQTIKNQTLPVLIHPLTQELIRLDPEDSYQYSKIKQQIARELAPNPLYVMSEIVGFHLIGFNGAYFSNIGIRDRMESFKDLEYTSENFHVLGMTDINNIPTITVYRHIIDQTNYRAAGVMVLDISLEYIWSILDEPQFDERGQLKITEPSGKYILHPDRERVGKRIEAPYREQMIHAKGSFFMEDQHGGKTIGVYSQSDETGLTVIYEVPLHVLIQPLIQLRELTLIIISLLGAVTVITLFVFYWILIKPLFELLKVMKSVRMGNLGERVTITRNDEIGMILQGFNLMVDHINALNEASKKSIQKEAELRLQHKEAILQSLQARINPHFLYNSLEIINAYAIAARIKPISKIAVLLAKIFRYSTSGFDKEISLYTEMQHVQNYLSIQKERFKDLEIRLEYEDADLVRVRAFKLLVQPVIENAFIHGYEKNQMKPEFIGIYGEKKENMYVVKVIDRGQGMDPQLMERYNKAFLDFTGDEILEEGGVPFERTGLWNVHTRLRIAYGKPYGLHIARSNDQGTEIHIMFPYFSTDEVADHAEDCHR